VTNQRLLVLFRKEVAPLLRRPEQSTRSSEVAYPALTGSISPTASLLLSQVRREVAVMWTAWTTSAT
jgi:hypothetical protein